MSESDTNRQAVVNFFAQYGAAMGQWAKIEFRLHALLAVILRTKTEFASIIFLQIKNNEFRIQLIDKLVRASKPSDEEKTLWKEILTDLKTGHTHRNNLAHYQATRTTRAEDGTILPPQLVPHWPLGGFLDNSKTTYTVRDLYVVRREMQETERKLVRFIGMIGTRQVRQ